MSQKHHESKQKSQQGEVVLPQAQVRRYNSSRQVTRVIGQTRLLSILAPHIYLRHCTRQYTGERKKRIMLRKCQRKYLKLP
jgi:hypothetical protein